MKHEASSLDSNVYSSSSMISAQRMHQSAGTNHFPGRLDNFRGSETSYLAVEDHHRKSLKVEGQWQWDRDAQRISSQISSNPLNEGQGVKGSKSYYMRHVLDPQMSIENQSNNEPGTQMHEQDMEIGYEDNPLPLTFDGLEQKFHDEILKLVREHNVEEDAEQARHEESMIEINKKYREKLYSLRTQQASRREEFLLKESQVRLLKYNQAALAHYPNIQAGSSHPKSALEDAPSYSEAAVGAATGEAHRAYDTGRPGSYREHTRFPGSETRQEAERRVPYPEGRVYNIGPRSYR